MDFRIENEGEDFGTIVFIPRQNDSFEISGYSNDIEIKIPLYEYQAKELLSLVKSLADKDPES